MYLSEDNAVISVIIMEIKLMYDTRNLNRDFTKN